MFELASSLLPRLARGERLAVATVVRVVGSAPRDLGTSMAVADDGTVLGSISGGCVEGAVVEVAERVLAGGASETAAFGISDEQAFAVGLSCGGELEVLVRPIDGNAARTETAELAAAATGQAAGSALIAVGPAELVGIPVAEVTDATLVAAGVRGLSAARLASAAGARIRSGWTGRFGVQCEGPELEVFVESRLAAPQLVISGAVDFARALADAAALLGYVVTVVDPRSAFATADRFPAAREVVADWPDELIQARTASGLLDERSVVAVLAHGQGDVEAVAAALRSPAGYVGAMGSRRTHERRMRALAEAGVTPAELARLHSPIGLDLGAATPEEAAVSILAEVIASRSGRAAGPLAASAGPIHPR